MKYPALPTTTYYLDGTSFMSSRRMWPTARKATTNNLRHHE